MSMMVRAEGRFIHAIWFFAAPRSGARQLKGRGCYNFLRRYNFIW
jgi:hypothetical protein